MSSESDSKTPTKFVKVFEIRSITHTDDKEIIWGCKFYGEPFWVHPEEDSKLRKEWWLDPDYTLGGECEAHYNLEDKKGVPQGHITGTLFKRNKKYVEGHKESLRKPVQEALRKKCGCAA